MPAPDPRNYLHLPLGDHQPDEINVVVEIPEGSRNKYEYDKTLDIFRLDRALHSSIHYPGDYGFCPRTLALDDDPLDVLVLAIQPTFTGCLVAARPIGLARHGRRAAKRTTRFSPSRWASPTSTKSTTTRRSSRTRCARSRIFSRPINARRQAHASSGLARRGLRAAHHLGGASTVLRDRGIIWNRQPKSRRSQTVGSRWPKRRRSMISKP